MLMQALQVVRPRLFESIRIVQNWRSLGVVEHPTLVNNAKHIRVLYCCVNRTFAGDNDV